MYNRSKDKNIKSKVVVVKNKPWDKDKIIKLLLTNDKAVERAILLLYSFQTEDERIYGHTGVINGKGFNRLDANILSSFAEQITIKKKPLSYKQLIIARKKLVKYTGQILDYMAEQNKIKN